MKRLLVHLLYYSRSQQAGVLTLTLLLLLALLVPYGYHNYLRHDDPQADSLQSSAPTSEIENFLAHLQTRRSTPRFPQTRYPGDAFPRSIADATLFPFNPNEADSITFRQLGLPGWMTQNILRYRSKGGRFRQANDFQKIYGLSAASFQTLLPYIQIPPDTATTQRTPAILLTTLDSLSYAKTEKFAHDTVIELNTADTTLLKKIPGIGSGIARRIVSYRQQLGGFYSVKQLREIQLNDSLLRPWFHIDPTHIRRIPVNRASVERLHRHPYINFYQAKALVEHRRQEGPLKSLKPFILLEEFPAKDCERMQHYLSFETPPAE